MTHTPRLTAKVLRGLVIIRLAITSGRTLDMEKPEVRRALQWIAHVDQHRQRYAVAKRWLDA